MVRVHPSGSATVYTGTSPHGQGLDTSFAQIAADRLGIDPENVDVLHGDTDQGAWGWGTYGSRSICGRRRGGRQGRARRCRRRRSASAPRCSRRRPTTSSWPTASSRCAGRRTSRRRWPRSRSRRTSRRNELPADIEPGLEENSFYDPENFVFPFGAHACVVDVDAETGKVKVVRYVAVDDCGPAINPMLIDGQIHGGIVHAIGQALYEQVVYDEDGQLVTGTFVDYALPTAAEVPSIRDRSHRDAVAGQLARGQGHRRGRHDRRHPGGHGGGAGRARAVRRRLARHAAHAGAGLAGDQRQGQRRPRPPAGLGEHGMGSAGSGPSSPAEGGAS